MTTLVPRFEDILWRISNLSGTTKWATTFLPVAISCLLAYFAYMNQVQVPQRSVPYMKFASWCFVGAYGLWLATLLYADSVQFADAGTRSAWAEREAAANVAVRQTLASAAKMPQALVKQPHVHPVRDMPVGEAAFMGPYEIEVDQEGRCFLEAEAKTYPESTPWADIRVGHEADGYHLDLRGKDYRFIASDLVTATSVAKGKYIPVRFLDP